MTRHPTALRLPTRRRGFTLLEMMTVSFLLAILLSAVYATFRVSMHSMEIAERRTQLYHTVRVVTGGIQRDLASLWMQAPAPGESEAAAATSDSDETTTGTPTLKGSVSDLGGVASSQLEMLTALAPMLDDPGPQITVAYVSYYLDLDESTVEEGLVRAEDRYVDRGEAEETTTVETLCESVSSFEVRYYHPQDEEWVEEWDSNQLPTAVLVSLTFDDPSGEEESISITQTVALPKNLGGQIGEEIQQSETATGTGEMDEATGEGDAALGGALTGAGGSMFGGGGR